MIQVNPNTRLLILALLFFGGVGAIPVSAQDASAWDDALDAVAAAPDSHRVPLENDHVRVLEVVIRPGQREPAHTLRRPSVMVGLEASRIRSSAPSRFNRLLQPRKGSVPSFCANSEAGGLVRPWLLPSLSAQGS